MRPGPRAEDCVNETLFPDDWTGALRAGLRASRAGRAVLLSHFGNLRHVEKKFQAGLVSEADKGSEKAIIDVLKKAYPHSEILGEESDAAGAKVQRGRGGPNGRWIIDPLDGTTNYIHRFPIFCISIGLEVDGDLKVAVIDVPVLGETYTAVRGRGAFLNGKPIRVSSTADVSDALLATGFFAENKDVLREQLSLFNTVVGDARGVRRAGAAAYDLALVASGVFDAFWEKGLKPWDSAAGQLLVEEAGGTVLDFEGQKHDPYRPFVIAGNPTIVAQVRERFAARTSKS